MEQVRRYILSLLLPVIFTSISYAFGDRFAGWQCRPLSVQDGLPSNQVRQIYQDREGYVWIATDQGISQYDGYSVRNYKSNLYTPGLLNNNKTFCFAEDGRKRIYIGTFDGMNVLDKTTGQVHRAAGNRLNGQAVTSLCLYSPDTLLVGTECCIYAYSIPGDSCTLFLPDRMPHASIQEILRDSKGYYWFGSWDEGLFRYDPARDKLDMYEGMYLYDERGRRAEATRPTDGGGASIALHEDRKGQLWVGTWKYGLYCIENPQEESGRFHVRHFCYERDEPGSLPSDYIYAISEDLNTRTLWVATRNGLSILIDEAQGQFRNCLPEEMASMIPYNVVSTLLRDASSNMWIGTLGGGVSHVVTRPPLFTMDRLEQVKQEYLYSHQVRTLMADRQGTLWIGFDTYGFILYDRKTGRYTYNMEHPDFKAIGRIPSINVIRQSPTSDKVWIGTYDWGLILYDPSLPEGKRGRRLDNATPWLCQQRILDILEDREGNTWFATRNGLCALKADGVSGFRFDTCRVGSLRMSDYAFTSLVQDSSGTIWAGSSNGGVVRFMGKPEQIGSIGFRQYAPSNGKLNEQHVLCLLLDKRGRLWAGTEGGGLNLFDTATDRFQPVHQLMQLPGDAIFSMQEDMAGNLWMATAEGLVRLTVPEDPAQATYRLYTTADGLQPNLCTPNAAFTDINGEMLFGGQEGFNSFFPDRMVEEESFPPIVITNVKVYNRPWSSMAPREKEKISREDPDAATRLTFNHRQNNFNIEFATLAYANPAQVKYAYKLDGFDTEWHYTDASRRFAYYNNLGSGTYTFLLKATNGNNIWNPAIRSLQVKILPPPWLTWWAWTLYLLLALLLLYAALRFARHRMKLQNALHLAELEQAKIQEVNHLKLQFFTNITHELLTPLTIISAAVDELRTLAPGGKGQYQVMTNNINRLIRLLQQILEFRKAETGNLKLKVSRGDLPAFVRTSVDSFRPLIKKKQMTFRVTCVPETFEAYFDPDKLDKILYNLLSNAAKYNTPGTSVEVSLALDGERHLQLRVKDNGKGLTAEEKKNLFKRFYEGNYRKFNTIGTGIGLSLTHDLVVLHHGSITVESEPGAGTAFCVTLPVRREDYAPEEVDDTLTVHAPAPLPAQPDNTSEEETEQEENTKEAAPVQPPTLLLIEDSEELLALMRRLLQADYRIVTAADGKEGLEKMQTEEIDLVVSDIMMPEMDGIAFCKAVKSDLQTCHIPVILLTAKTSEQDRVEAYDAGAEGFITKPFNLSVLHAKISNLLKAKERGMRDFKRQLVFKAKELNYTSLDEDFLKRTVDIIHAHLDDPDLDQQTFLDALGLSKSTFYRKIKSLTGLSISTFIRNIRLKAACQLMEEKRGGLRISELAYAVGFNDPKYFSVCFKKEFGMQPTEYMERFTQADHP